MMTLDPRIYPKSSRIFRAMTRSRKYELAPADAEVMLLELGASRYARMVAQLKTRACGSPSIRGARLR